jgi:glutamine synthetase
VVEGRSEQGLRGGALSTLEAMVFSFAAVFLVTLGFSQLAVLVLVGLRGLRDRLPEPPLTSGDLSERDEEERTRLGVRPLPGSLEEALEALEADAVVRSWFSRDLWDCYRSVKRTEISLLKGADPKEACERYSRVY